MATPPTRTFGATPTAGWASTASPKTSPAFDVQAGDLLVLIAFTEDAFYTLTTPTWTGTGTWALRQSVVVGSYCTAYLYTCEVTATATGRTATMARTGCQWSFYVSGWRNHGGLGVSGKANVASGAPALNLASAANSAVVVGNSDWTANGGSWSWRTVNGSVITETSRGGTAGSTYMCYSGYVPDTGAAGTNTYGMLTPSTQKYSIVGIEVLGTTATTPSYSWTLNLTGAGILTGTTRPAFTWAAGLGGAGALGVVSMPAFGWDGYHDGAGTLAAGGVPHFTWTTDLAGTGALTAETTTGRAWIAPFDSGGTLTTEASPAFAWDAVVAGDGTLTANLVPKFGWDAHFTSGGTLAANLASAFQWDAVFTGDGLLTADLVKGRGWYHILTGTGTLTSAPVPHFTWTALLAGAGTLSDKPEEPNMAQPSPDWNLVLIKWAGVMFDGTPCTGRIKVSYNKPANMDPKAPLMDDDPQTPLSIYMVELAFPLTTKTVLYGGAPREVGYVEFYVPATDDPDIIGSGGTYTCTEALDKGASQTPFKFLAPIATPLDGLWLNKAEHVA